MLEILWYRISEFFSLQKFALLASEALINLGSGLLVFGFFYALWRISSRILMPRLQMRVDRTNAAMFETAFKVFVLSLGLLAALGTAGVQTTAVLTSLGVLSLTIGFALRDTLSNVISGFLVFMDRPFTIDDLVEVDGQYGRVDRITLRTTRIVTNDGRVLAVPNALVMNKTVISYTNFPHLRLSIEFTVAVTESLDRVRTILMGLVQSNPAFLAEPPPRMVVVSLNDYNIALELQVWLNDERQHIQQRFDLREAVFKALTAAGVNMPLQTIQLAPMQVDMLRNRVA